MANRFEEFIHLLITEQQSQLLLRVVCCQILDNVIVAHGVVHDLKHKKEDPNKRLYLL